MPNFFDRFRKSVISGCCQAAKTKDLNNKIALGALLWVSGAVAEANGEFRPEESEQIKKILLSRFKISEQDFPIVLTAMRQTAIEKIDFYRVVEELKQALPYSSRVSIVEDFFRVAASDKRLDRHEVEIIDKISRLWDLAEQDLTDLKLRVGRESGLDVA